MGLQELIPNVTQWGKDFCSLLGSLNQVFFPKCMETMQ